jgi:hypothetical protein
MAGLVGVVLFATPVALLFGSEKSPLWSRDAGYINGFVMGMGFLFYLMVGGVLVGTSALYLVRHRASLRGRRGADSSPE